MTSRLRRLVLAVAVLGVAATAAVAQPPPPATTAQPSRVALIIGNSAYAAGPLNNPKNDARGMSEALRALGFDVVVRENAKNLDMRRAVVEFGEKLTAGGVGLFYYSGHGMQVGGKNYLLPVDADLKSERYVSVESLDVDSVLAQMDSAKSAVNIVILDACRDNPFARRFRSASRGLAFMDAPTGTYIAYATSPGNVAEDGTPGQYGVYTGELLKAMKEPGLPIEEVFKRVRQSVVSKTNGRQSPWDASSLTGAFYFQRGAAAAAPPRESVAAVRPVTPPASSVREEIVREAGSLALRAKLEGVEVVVGDRVVGETRSGRAIVVDNLPVGAHRVRARKQGYKDWERDVTIAANQRVELVIDIEPLRPEAPRPLRVIFDDDFKVNRTWPTGRSEFCEKHYTPDGYVVANIREAGGCTVFRAGRVAGPARLELSFRRLKGRLEAGLGLLFGATEDVGHTFSVSGAPNKAIQLFLEEPKKKERRVLLPPRRDSNVNEGLGATNVIAVEVRDRTIQCYVNGKFITTLTSPELAYGRLGVTLGHSVEAVFTRLVVTELAAE